jgi:hypothetical protein
MKRKTKCIGLRVDCETWKSLATLAKFGNTDLSKTIIKIFDMVVPQLLNRIPADRLAEIKKELQEK